MFNFIQKYLRRKELKEIQKVEKKVTNLVFSYKGKNKELDVFSEQTVSNDIIGLFETLGYKFFNFTGKLYKNQKEYNKRLKKYNLYFGHGKHLEDNTEFLCFKIDFVPVFNKEDFTEEEINNGYYGSYVKNVITYHFIDNDFYDKYLK